MISTTVYSEFYDHVRTYTGATRIFYFIHLTDLNANDYKYSNYSTHYSSYVPIRLIGVGTAVMRASAFTGEYSISPIRVTLENSPHPQGDTTYSRFSATFSAEEFETADCTIYLGYQGIEDDAGALFPFYKGRIANFSYSFNLIEFDLVDRGLLDLPDLPINTFDLTNYPYIEPSLVGKPIPLVYGYWDNEALNTNKFGEWLCVPAYVVENRLAESTPKLVVECADHALYAIGETFIYDPALDTIGAIQDTVVDSTSTARATITFNTANVKHFLSAQFYHYFDRLGDSTAITNEANATDHNFDTHATFTAYPTPSSLKLIGAPAQPFNDSELEPIYSVSAGTDSTGLADVQIQLSLYAENTLGGGDFVQVDIQNTGFSETVTPTTTEPTTFNITLATKLQICYPTHYDGSTILLFNFEEADDGAGTGATGSIAIYPREGYYSTMAALASEIQYQLQQKTDASTIQNGYACSYDKFLNKIVIKVESGTKYFRGKSGGNSNDIGYTIASPSYVNDSFSGASVTLLDVPDGDFSLVKLSVTNVVTSGAIYVKGARIRMTRKYSDYNKAGPKYHTFYNPFSRKIEQRRYGEFGEREDRRGSSSQGRGRIRKPYSASESIRSEVGAARFYMAVAGVPVAGEGYCLTGGTIISDLLLNQIGIAAGNVDSHALTVAKQTTQFKNLACYIDRARSAREIIADLARHSGGFVCVNEEGKYTLKVIKASYTTSDVNLVLNYREIAAPFSSNFRLSRHPISQVSNDLTFAHIYNHAREEYMREVGKTTDKGYNITASRIESTYVNKDTVADALAEFYCGVTATYGHYGDLKTVVVFKTLHAKWLFSQLGDIVSFSSAWTDATRGIDAFGKTIDNLYFMITEKQANHSSVTITMVEVGDAGLAISPDGADLFQDIFFEDALI